MSSLFSLQIPVWSNYLSTNKIHKTHLHIKLPLLTLENLKMCILNHTLPYRILIGISLSLLCRWEN